MRKAPRIAVSLFASHWILNFHKSFGIRLPVRASRVLGSGIAHSTLFLVVVCRSSIRMYTDVSPLPGQGTQPGTAGHNRTFHLSGLLARLMAQTSPSNSERRLD